MELHLIKRERAAGSKKTMYYLLIQHEASEKGLCFDLDCVEQPGNGQALLGPKKGSCLES